MKIALITDTHWGARAESPVFNDYFFKFWDNVFFPYLEQHNIKQIIHLGDVVDRRKFINYVILNSLRTKFIKRLGDMGCDMHVIVGNHDVPFRNTNEINAISELFSEHEHIHVIHEPTEMIYGGVMTGLKIAIIPWINATNYKSTLEFIEKTGAQIAMGHLEVAGFEMDKGNVCNTGIKREIFKKFEKVYTGHFHHKSTDGHIFYLGNTYEMTWADYNDKRGFHVFDTETREVEFIENPYRMFHKVVYDDSQETLESVNAKDFSSLNKCIIKVIVAKKENPILFDHFMDALYKAEPLDVSIVEDFVEYSQISDEDIIDQADSTTEIIEKYIESVEMTLDRSKLKNIMREIYIEAQNLEV